MHTYRRKRKEENIISIVLQELGRSPELRFSPEGAQARMLDARHGDSELLGFVEFTSMLGFVGRRLADHGTLGFQLVHGRVASDSGKSVALHITDRLAKGITRVVEVVGSPADMTTRSALSRVVDFALGNGR